MKKSLLTVVALLVMSSMSFGAILSLDKSVTAIAPAAGQTFDLTVSLNPENAVGGIQTISYWLTTDAPGGIFKITARALGAGRTSAELQSTNAQVVANGALPQTGTVANSDLGAAFDMPVTAPSILCTLTISTLVAPAPGIYTFAPFAAASSDTEFNEITPQMLGTSVVVTPEPISMILLAIGGLFISRRK